MEWLNYHHLLYFWVVAREGSVAAATTHLHLTQPTISSQIHALEKSLGQKLFTKRGRNLVLTETGHAVFRYADEIFSLGRELVQSVKGASGQRPSRFAVGISDSLPKLTTYKLLEPALRIAPPFKLYVRIDKTESLLASLAVHGLDMVLSDVPVSPSVNVRAFSHLLGECGISIFGTPALARRHRSNFPQSLQNAPMLLQTVNTALRRSLDQWFDGAGITPAIVGEVEDMAMLQVLGQHGLGLFAAPTIVENEVCRQHHVRVVGQLKEVRERFYAISVERRIRHPAVVAVSTAARDSLLST